MPETAFNSKLRREDWTLKPCLCFHHWNLDVKIAMKVAILQEPLKLPVLKSCCPAEKQVDLVVTLVCQREELV